MEATYQDDRSKVTVTATWLSDVEMRVTASRGGAEFGRCQLLWVDMFNTPGNRRNSTQAVTAMVQAATSADDTTCLSVARRLIAQDGALTYMERNS